MVAGNLNFQTAIRLSVTTDTEAGEMSELRKSRKPYVMNTGTSMREFLNY